MNQLHHRQAPVKHQILCWLAILTTVLSGSTSLALPAGDLRVEATISGLRSAADDLGRTFDTEAILDRRDYDAQSIVEFVTEEISFQPYPGVLRGVKGTLAGRSGNAHDQALTLATLLRNAGYDAQILVGAITRQQAQMLVEAMDSPEQVSLNSSSLDKGLLDDTFAITRELGQSTGNLTEAASSYARGLTEKIVERFDQGLLLSNSLRDSMAYRWVRYREGPGDPWIEVHPAHPGAEAWQLKFEKVETEQIQSSDLQMVEVEAFIEDSNGERRSVTGIWKSPAASLMENPLTIELLSDAALRHDQEKGLEGLLAESEFFFFQINGALPEEGKVFDLHGDVLSGSAMEGLNSIFSTANRRVRSAIDALSTDKSAADSQRQQQLTRVWIEFRLSAPAAGMTLMERTLFEGNALSDRTATAARLVQRWDIDALSVTPLPEYYPYRSAELLASALEGYRKMQNYIDEPGVPSVSEFGSRAVKAIGNPAMSRLMYLRQMFDRFQAPASVVTFPVRPNLLAVRQGFSSKEGRWIQYEMTDIVSNTRVAFRKANGAIEPAFETTVARGVWETQAESFRPGATDSVKRTSAYDVLTESSVEDLSLERSDEMLVIADDGSNAWWQVDSISGSTIGMQHTEIGQGGMATDYLTVLTVGVSVVFFMIGTNSCVQATNDVECCFMTNLSISIVGFALGFSAGLVGVAFLGQTAGSAVGASTSVLADLGLSDAPTFCT